MFQIWKTFYLPFNFLCLVIKNAIKAAVPKVTTPAKAIKTYHNGLIGSMTSFRPLTSASCKVTDETISLPLMMNTKPKQLLNQD